MDLNNLLWFAAVLLVVWVVARVVGAITGFLLNLLWIGALLMVAIWFLRKYGVLS